MNLLRTSVNQVRVLSNQINALRTGSPISRKLNHTQNMSNNSRPSSPTSGSSNATINTSTPSLPPPKITFELSPVPPNPLGEGRCIRTAAALIIGYASFHIKRAFEWTWSLGMKFSTVKPWTGIPTVSPSTVSRMESTCTPLLSSELESLLTSPADEIQKTDWGHSW